MNKIKATNDSLINEFLQDSNYQVNPDGSILTRLSLNGRLTNEWRTVSYKIMRGYQRVSYKNKNLAVHRIVYAKYIGKLDSNLVVNHLDGCRSNNLIFNLELITHDENVMHGSRINRNKAYTGSKIINHEIAEEIRRKIKEENIRAYELVKQYGLGRTTISNILKNNIWKKVD